MQRQNDWREALPRQLRLPPPSSRRRLPSLSLPQRHAIKMLKKIYGNHTIKKVHKQDLKRKKWILYSFANTQKRFFLGFLA
ncbi:hypothetical protein ACJIZ3_015663 [Penstemon smallii]|uniref:Uncharacterized protein n=1 Tax=Penstemon smallii TaxID=265156 RepID=A0ABD3RUQ4_9LAMI